MILGEMADQLTAFQLGTLALGEFWLMSKTSLPPMLLLSPRIMGAKHRVAARHAWLTVSLLPKFWGSPACESVLAALNGNNDQA